MRTNVSLKKPRSGETLSAVVALAALAVSAHVHGERRHGHVHFVAVWTPPRLLVGQRAVRLSVPGQVAGRAVPFAALAAHVHIVLFCLLPTSRRTDIDQ